MFVRQKQTENSGHDPNIRQSGILAKKLFKEQIWKLVKLKGIINGENKSCNY